MQSLEGTAGRTGRIQTLHALALHKRKRRPIFWLIELDNVAGEFVQISRRLMQLVAADVRRGVIGLGTSRFASLAADADAGVVEQSDGSIGKRNLLCLQGLLCRR